MAKHGLIYETIIWSNRVVYKTSVIVVSMDLSTACLVK